MKSEKERKQINLVENSRISLKSRYVITIKAAPNIPREHDTIKIISNILISLGGKIGLLSSAKKYPKASPIIYFYLYLKIKYYYYVYLFKSLWYLAIISWYGEFIYLFVCDEVVKSGDEVKFTRKNV